MVVDVGDGVRDCASYDFCLRGELVQNDEIEAKLTFFIFTKFGCTFQVIHFVFFVPFDVKYAAIKNTHN